MKKILLFLFLCSQFTTVAQEDAWVYFNTKPNFQYYYDNPLQMLSQRALDRRIAQNIPLDYKDVLIHQPYIDQISVATGITVKAKSKWLNALHIQGTQADINALSNLTFVDHIEFANNSLNLKIAQNTPKHIAKFQEIKVDYNYGNSSVQTEMLHVQTLHQNNYTGSGKIIAIMDAGFPGVDTTLPFKRLRDNGQILGGHDFVNNTTNPYTGFQHGTQVLSTMGGYSEGQLIGTAPDAKYYLFITEDVSSETPLEESYWVEAAEVADSLGVDVINTSLGYFTFDNPNYNYTYADMNGTTSFISRGASIAFTRGMITVTSAGNSGSTSEPHIAVPADVENTLTVGAVNSSLIKASFSSIGPTADDRLKPDVMAMGVASVVATQTGSISTNNGTSFSSPIIAGAVASFWSAFPAKTNLEIVQLVKQSSNRYTTPNNDYGYGIPNFEYAMQLSIDSFQDTIFEVYPNPTQSELTLTIPKKLKGGTFTLYNCLGQNVLEKNATNSIEKIGLTNIATGMYYYYFSLNDMVISGKILKN